MTDKLPDEQNIKLENLNLAIEKEELYSRMVVLSKECKKLKGKNQQLTEEFDQQSNQLKTL